MIQGGFTKILRDNIINLKKFLKGNKEFMKKILVHHKRNETAVAILEDDKLVNYYVDRDDEAKLIGNIYKGKIQNFLPGIQAAFVDIGRDKNAFLQLSKKETFEIGQDILIQIKKEAIGTKGPRATTAISIPGHNIVYIPGVKYIGISHKVSGQNRKKLFDIAQKAKLKDAGLIIRTAAEECDESEIIEEIYKMQTFWKSLTKNLNKKKSPKLLYSDNDLMSKIIRDELTNDVDEFLIDSLKITQKVKKLVKHISPNLVEKIHRYEEKIPIFEKFNISAEILHLNDREVELPSGGFIVIDKTEALIAIDVNTGKFVGDLNLSDTVFKANIEAAEMIMRQLRLRNIGGIIIVDFIDMPKEDHKAKLIKFLREEAKKDRVKTKIIDMTPLGLVEITRRRLK